MIKEPAVPKDKKCVVCKKKLKPIDGPGAGHADAFCSTTCCREYFGTTDSISNPVVSVKG